MSWKGKGRHSRKKTRAQMRNMVLTFVLVVALAITMVPTSAFTYAADSVANAMSEQAQESSSDSAQSSEARSSDDAVSQSTVLQDEQGTGTEQDVESEQPAEGAGSENADTSVASEDDGSAQGGASASAGKKPAPTSGAPADSTPAAGTSDEGRKADNQAARDDEAAGQENAASQQRDPRAWQNDLDTTTFSGLLTIDAADIEGSAWGATELPELLPATLHVGFELDPGSEQLIAGDWVKVDLPAFLHAEDTQLDVFRLNDDGAETDEKVAEADVKSGFVKITLSDAAVAEGASAAVCGYVDIPVTLASALLGEEETQQSWVVQADKDGVERIVMLGLPTYDAVLGAWKAAKNPIGLLGSALGVSDGTVTAQNTGARVAEAGSTTYSLSGFTGGAQMIITWCDNNSATRPMPDSYRTGVLPQFSLDGGATWISLVDSAGDLTSQAREALHLDGGVSPAWAQTATINRVSVSDWQTSISGLPTQLNTITRTPVTDEQGNQQYDQDGSPLYDTDTSTTGISWRLYDTNDVPDGYVYGSQDGGPTGNENGQQGHRYLMKTQEFTYTITGKLGGQTLEEVFGSNFSGADADRFTFSASIDGEPQGSTALADMVAQYGESGRFKIEYSQDGMTATISAVVPLYDIQGSPIMYSISFDETHDEGTDWYQSTYDNSASPSHGSATDALYDGGTMTLRPVGTETYDAQKMWLDGGNKQNRPETTFTLWRYSTQGSAATASQVQLDSSQLTTPEAQVNSVDYVSITVPAGSAGTVDLGELLGQKYGDGTGDSLDGLPKYDPDGYPYIYALREDAVPAGYELVFGEVDNAGAVRDTAPNYVDGTGATQYLPAVNRANDPLIYNDGTATNRLTGQVEVRATKTWEIAAFQNALDNVEVTFTLQSRLAGSQNAWQDTDKTQKVGDWKAEMLTQTFAGTFSKYDSQGRELEYRWVETGVSLDGQDIAFARDENGGGTFTLQLENAEGVQESLDFTSTRDEQTNIITNRFSNVTDEHVDKFWEQPDGTLAQVKPQESNYNLPEGAKLDCDGIAQVQLFQDGQIIGTFEMDGTTDTTPTNIANLQGATYQETSSYHLDFENLPKYSSNGVRYTYLVLETGKTGWHAERSYDPKTRTTRIDNRIGLGEGSEIRIAKDWIDGNDSLHRLSVKVDLVAVDEIRARKNIDPQTGELYHYMPGETVISGIVLSADNSWFTEVDVPIGSVNYRNFKVVERALVGSDGTEYPVTDKAGAADAYAGIDISKSWINEGWDYESTAGTWRVATPDHVYQAYATKEAAPQYDDNMQAVTATNRRLGLFDLTVTKTWNDGVEHDRPGAELVVSCTERQGVFSIDDSGRVWAQLSGGSRLPVMNGNGEGARQLNAEQDGIRLEGSTLVKTINTSSNENKSEYHFFGLPKYDGEGEVVHYDVTERWVGDNGPYTSTREVKKYNVGKQHFHDSQTIDFSNTRAETRDVVFYKHWLDHYVNDELAQRPDIYLTLYRVTVSPGETSGSVIYSEPQLVSGYVNYLWNGVGVEGSDPQYEQKCTIAGLPAYDAKGNAYIYFASESMSVADPSTLDYAPVRFNYDRVTGVHEDTDEAKAVRIPGEQQASDDPETNGVGWAIHEGGVFENALTSNVIATGVKLWDNVPGNVAQADLPALTIYLQRREVGQNWPELTFAKGADDTWTPGEGQVIAWTTHLEEDATNQYSYALAHEGENGADPQAEQGTPLARYADDGTRYEYRAVEVPWGLYNAEGGFDDEDLGLENGVTKDLSNLHDDNTQLGVVVVEHGETGSFLIRNRYSSPKGQLTVQKHFTGREAGDCYPATTFDVYRYYVNAQGERSDAARVASTTLTHDMLSGAGGESLAIENADGTNANNTAEYTFANLDIYAPDGSFWQYYVVEHSINGYETTVGMGDLAPDQVTESGTSVDDGVSSGALCPEAVGGSGAVEGTVLGTINDDGTVTTDTAPDVTFKNNYVPELVKLTGSKAWSDYNGIFDTRPTPEQFKAGLKVERIGNGTTTDITAQLQSSAPEEPNYFAVNQAGDSIVYDIAISNVEKWAPDGSAWQYRLTEDLSAMPIEEGGVHADTYYDASVGLSSTVSADSSSQFRLRNSLKGTAAVEKHWVDGDNPYGLRPDTVTVRLQAREADSGDLWQDAYEFLGQFATPGQLEGAGFVSSDFTKTLSAANGWKRSWSSLPLAARHSSDEALVSIEYRVVEVAIGDQKVEQPKADTPAAGASSIYATLHPYQPTQSEDGNTSVITNTLETTKISATKSWTDAEDVWDTRPGNGTTWSVTYLLQRKLVTEDEAGWKWLMEYGAEQADSPLDASIVSETISGTEDSAAVSWESLPKCDEKGDSYDYRVVERVPGSYDIDGGTPVAEATANGVAYRYYVVESTDGAQTFTNNLRTVELKGTKRWESYGSNGLVPSVDGTKPQMTLYRAVKNSDGSFGAAEQVKMKDGSAPAQPAWVDNGDGTWTFTYNGLPAADQNNRSYTYWAEESVGSVPGFYPVYGTADAAGTNTSSPDVQKGTDITNVATRLSLAKVSDWPGDEPLKNIELSVRSTDGSKTFAVWTNGADGKTYSATTWVGGTNNPQDPSTGITRDDGLIVGLPAGNYKVVETGAVPEGYAKAQDVDFTINADGTANKAAGVNTSMDAQEHTYTIAVTATDPVLRGHLQLTKHVSDDGAFDGPGAAALANATFDLYCNGFDDPIAIGLVSDANGIVATNGRQNGTIELSKAFKEAHDGKYTRLSDGLPEGTYYFVETDATTGAVMPQGEAAKSSPLTITQDSHFAYTNTPVSAQMGNEDFSARVILHKYDAETNAPIGGAVFQIDYTPEEGSSTTHGRVWTVQSAADGTVSFDGLEKGSYVVTELSNTGYVANDFRATFVIADDDDDQVYDITTTDESNAAVSAIGFKVTSAEGTFVDGVGIPNAPQHGSATIAKTGANNAALNGATFELQRMNGADWTTQTPTTIAEGLVTDRTYQMNDENTALVNAQGTENTTTNGRITVNNLRWGTYRFVETAPAPGYAGVSSDGSAIASGDLVIGRTSLNPSLTGNSAVRNTPTNLEVNKKSDDNEPLEGAEFEVTPQDGSRFVDKSSVKTLVTNSEGYARLTGQLIVGNIYEIYESKAPTGYDPVDESLVIVVLPTGELQVVGDMPQGWERTQFGDSDDAFSFVATNHHEEVELMKVSSADGKPLAGVGFTLTGLCMDRNTTHSYTTNADGYLLIDAGLRGGVDYTLYETSPATGYALLDGQLEFRMNSRGEITPTGDVPEGWTVNYDKISLKVADDPVELQITKHASEGADGTPGKALEGATFTITPVDGSAFADSGTEARSFTTNGDGIISSSADLVVGNQYDITEVSAPQGYEIVSGTMRVQVGNDGSINVLGSVGADGNLIAGTQPPTGYEKVANSAFEVQVTDEPIEIGIVKVNADDTATRLAGATFELTGEFANSSAVETKTFTTDENGVPSIDLSAQLKSGQQYTLTETGAPEGYEKAAGAFTFEVAPNGTITSVGDVPEGYAIEANMVTITVSNQPVEIALVKLGRDSGTDGLSGAEFLVKPAAGSSFANAKADENENGIAVTPANISTVLDRKLRVGDSYTLKEMLAPSGYELIEGALEFTVMDDGTITKTGGVDAWTVSDDEGTAVITATDTPIEVNLIKTGTNTGGTSLTGAVFELHEGDSATGALVGDPMTTADEGAIALEGLVGGVTYTLHEVTAPAGYELLADVTFTVETDGTIEFQGTHEGYTAEEGQDGVIAFTASDTPIEAQLVKTDESGAPLAGGVFSIEGTFTGDHAGEDSLELDATGADGVATIPTDALIAGQTYTVTEVTAPEGYELAGSAEFTVATDGTIALTGTTEEAPAVMGAGGTGTYTASVTDGMATITATDRLTELFITKTDGDEGLLPGAEFAAVATLEEGETGPAHSVTATTGDDGTAVLQGLIAGKTYTLSETRAPAGYELLADTLTFTVADDGTIDAGLFPPAAFAIGEDKDALSVADDQLLVTMLKQAPNGAPLAGAEFTIEGTFADGATSKTFTSDADGVVFADMQLVGSAEGTEYTVTETRAPEGYELPEGTLSLLVYEDGTVEVGADSAADMRQAATVSDDDGTAVIELSNTPLPGTRLPQTDDSVPPWAPGVLGLGLFAILTAGIAGRLRNKGDHSIS